MATRAKRHREGARRGAAIPRHSRTMPNGKEGQTCFPVRNGNQGQTFFPIRSETFGQTFRLIVAWDPTEPVATRPLVLQRQGGWNFFYTHDGNKNVSDVVSFQQARGVPAHYEYAPFGAVTAATTNTAFTAFNVVETNPYRFSSEYSDDTLGLVYYNYRHYEQVIGRWLNFDFAPSEIAGVNKYIYCYNYPMSLTDYIGLAGKTTHGTRKCSDVDSCSDLAIKLSDWITHYAERHKELLEDKLNLKTNDPHRYNNHIDKAVEAIKNINRCADKILSHKPPCGCSLAPVPALLPLPERVSELTTCQKIVLSVPFSDDKLWAVQRGCIVVAAGAATAATVGSVPAVIGGLAGSSVPASRILPLLR